MYFKGFPKVPYTFNFKDNSLVAVTNIFSRFKVRSAVLSNTLAFYKYQVQDGETPEIISYKMYGDQNYHWLVCMANDIIDGQFSLPLSISSLENNIIKKYGYTAIEQAMAATHHYEKVVTTLHTLADGFSTETTEKSETSLQQYDFTSNTLVTKSTNNPEVETVTLRANTADISSAVTGTLTITTTYKSVNVYDYEIEQNEKNRSINILKKQYIPLIANEMEYMLYG
jgi:hypothetical protein